MRIECFLHNFAMQWWFPPRVQGGNHFWGKLNILTFAESGKMLERLFYSLPV